MAGEGIPENHSAIVPQKIRGAGAGPAQDHRLHRESTIMISNIFVIVGAGLTLVPNF